MLLSYKPVHLQAQQRLQEKGCVVDIKYLGDIRVLVNLCLKVLFYYRLWNRSIIKNNFEVVSYPTIPFVLTFIISYLAVFIFSDYKKLYLLSILHLYHHLFAELVHLYNLSLYWVCWGHKRLFVIWLQGCLRETIFILRLPRIDKP